MSRGGGPAFPVRRPVVRNDETPREIVEHGMSLRDYFATAALPPLLTCSMTAEGAKTFAKEAAVFKKEVHDYIAIAAYQIADAMLKAREQ